MGASNGSANGEVAACRMDVRGAAVAMITGQLSTFPFGLLEKFPVLARIG